MGRIHKTMTPAAEAANRSNGAESGGPASDPGKERSKMNALKHGRFADRPDPVELLLAQPSPEEEAERQALRAELVERYQPPDAFAEQAAEELADLRFELLRLERVKQALWQRERELLELEQRRRARAVQHRVQEAADQVSHDEVQKTGLMQAPESPGKYREMVVALEWAKVEMDRRDFRGAWSTLATVYGDLTPSWRGQKLLYLLIFARKRPAKARPAQKDRAGTRRRRGDRSPTRRPKWGARWSAVWSSCWAASAPCWPMSSRRCGRSWNCASWSRDRCRRPGRRCGCWRRRAHGSGDGYVTRRIFCGGRSTAS
jgi:hypothetical protein